MAKLSNGQIQSSGFLDSTLKLADLPALDDYLASSPTAFDGQVVYVESEKKYFSVKDVEAGTYAAIAESSTSDFGAVEAAGSDKEVQLNQGGVLGSDPTFVYADNKLGLGTSDPKRGYHQVGGGFLLEPISEVESLSFNPSTAGGTSASYKIKANGPLGATAPTEATFDSVPSGGAGARISDTRPPSHFYAKDGTTNWHFETPSQWDPSSSDLSVGDTVTWVQRRPDEPYGEEMTLTIADFHEGSFAWQIYVEEDLPSGADDWYGYLVRDDGEHVELSWPSVSGAVSYSLYKSVEGSTYMWIGSTDQTTFQDRLLSYVLNTYGSNHTGQNLTAASRFGGPVQINPTGKEPDDFDFSYSEETPQTVIGQVPTESEGGVAQEIYLRGSTTDENLSDARFRPSYTAQVVDARSSYAPGSGSSGSTGDVTAISATAVSNIERQSATGITATLGGSNNDYITGLGIGFEDNTEGKYVHGISISGSGLQEPLYEYIGLRIDEPDFAAGSGEVWHPIQVYGKNTVSAVGSQINVGDTSDYSFGTYQQGHINVRTHPEIEELAYLQGRTSDGDKRAEIGKDRLLFWDASGLSTLEFRGEASENGNDDAGLTIGPTYERNGALLVQPFTTGTIAQFRDFSGNTVFEVTENGVNFRSEDDTTEASFDRLSVSQGRAVNDHGLSKDANDLIRLKDTSDVDQLSRMYWDTSGNLRWMMKKGDFYLHPEGGEAYIDADLHIGDPSQQSQGVALNRDGSFAIQKLEDVSNGSTNIQFKPGPAITFDTFGRRRLDLHASQGVRVTPSTGSPGPFTVEQGQQALKYDEDGRLGLGTPPSAHFHQKAGQFWVEGIQKPAQTYHSTSTNGSESAQYFISAVDAFENETKAAKRVASNVPSGGTIYSVVETGTENGNRYLKLDTDAANVSVGDTYRWVLQKDYNTEDDVSVYGARTATIDSIDTSGSFPKVVLQESPDVPNTNVEGFLTDPSDEHVQISWEAVDGAAYYRIYKYTGFTNRFIGATTSNSWKDYTLSNEDNLSGSSPRINETGQASFGGNVTISPTQIDDSDDGRSSNTGRVSSLNVFRELNDDSELGFGMQTHLYADETQERLGGFTYYPRYYGHNIEARVNGLNGASGGSGAVVGSRVHASAMDGLGFDAVGVQIHAQADNGDHVTGLGVSFHDDERSEDTKANYVYGIDVGGGSVDEPPSFFYYGIQLSAPYWESDGERWFPIQAKGKHTSSGIGTYLNVGANDDRYGERSIAHVNIRTLAEDEDKYYIRATESDETERFWVDRNEIVFTRPNSSAFFSVSQESSGNWVPGMTIGTQQREATLTVSQQTDEPIAQFRDSTGSVVFQIDDNNVDLGNLDITAAGSDNQLQVNDSGTLAGTNGLTYDGQALTLQKSAGPDGSLFVAKDESGNPVMDVRSDGVRFDQSAHKAVLETTAADGRDINTTAALPIELGSILRSSAVYSTDADSITVGEDGLYKLYASIATKSGGQRVNPAVTFAINGEAIEGRGQSGYVRARSGHDEGSSDLSRVVDLTEGDVVTVRTEALGSGGSATIDGPNSIIRVEKLAGHFDRPFGDADTLQGLSVNELMLNNPPGKPGGILFNDGGQVSSTYPDLESSSDFTLSLSTQSVRVEAGQTVRFTFEKDGTLSTGADRAWIGEIRLPGGPVIDFSNGLPGSITNGTPGWEVVGGTAQSVNIGDGGKATMELTASSAGMVEFDYDVDAEAPNDRFVVTVEGNTRFQDSGRATDRLVAKVGARQRYTETYGFADGDNNSWRAGFETFGEYRPTADRSATGGGIETQTIQTEVLGSYGANGVYESLNDLEVQGLYLNSWVEGGKDLEELASIYNYSDVYGQGFDRYIGLMNNFNGGSWDAALGDSTASLVAGLYNYSYFGGSGHQNVENYVGLVSALEPDNSSGDVIDRVDHFLIGGEQFGTVPEATGIRFAAQTPYTWKNDTYATTWLADKNYAIKDEMGLHSWLGTLSVGTDVADTAAPGAAFLVQQVDGDPIAQFLAADDTERLTVSETGVRAKEGLRADRSLATGGSDAVGYGALSVGAPGYAAGSSSFSSGSGLSPAMTTRAEGDASFAQGDGARSVGEGSTAIGLLTTAEGHYSFAQGAATTAKGLYTVALGNRSQAVGLASIAGGRNAESIGSYSLAFGEEPVASGFASIALGIRTSAAGRASAAIGADAFAQSDHSIAAGRDAHTTGKYALAFGDGASAGRYATAIGGQDTTASGLGTVAIGSNRGADAQGNIGTPVRATADNAVAIGSAGTFSKEGSQATARSALALTGGEASGIESFAAGRGSVASGSVSVAFAQGKAEGSGAIAIDGQAAGIQSIGIHADADWDRSIGILKDSRSSGAVGIGVAGGDAAGRNAVAINGGSSHDYAVSILRPYSKNDGEANLPGLSAVPVEIDFDGTTYQVKQAANTASAPHLREGIAKMFLTYSDDQNNVDVVEATFHAREEGIGDFKLEFFDIRYIRRETNRTITTTTQTGGDKLYIDFDGETYGSGTLLFFPIWDAPV